MCEHGGRALHNERHGRRNIRPKQLRNREVSWEGSHRSKLMSRRTERPYKVDGAGKLAQHSAAPCSAPEINGPVVQREFTSLLRETCSPSPSATVGTVARNGCRAGAGVSRGRSTESNEPANPDGLTTREGLNLAGRHDHRWSCPGALTPTGRAAGSDHHGRERVPLRPQGLPGTAVPGPACQACPARASERRRMVWEAGGETLPPTRFGGITVCLEVYSAPPPLAPALINSAARNKNQLRRRSGRSR